MAAQKNSYWRIAKNTGLPKHFVLSNERLTKAQQQRGMRSPPKEGCKVIGTKRAKCNTCHIEETGEQAQAHHTGPRYSSEIMAWKSCSRS